VTTFTLKLETLYAAFSPELGVVSCGARDCQRRRKADYCTSWRRSSVTRIFGWRNDTTSWERRIWRGPQIRRAVCGSWWKRCMGSVRKPF